jgi:uncharacterized protein YjbI with pentapeptide repeats
MIMGGKAQAQDQQACQTPQRQSFSVLQMIVILIVGITAGAAATRMLLIGSLERATPWIDVFLHWALPVLGVSGAALVLVVPLTWWGVRRFIKGARGTLEQVAGEAISATRAASKGNAEDAADHTERAVREVLAWYGPIAARRWVVQTSLALLVGFGGLIGTAMLFRQTILLREQTELLNKQNEKLDLQTITAEAQRRGGLAAELFAILQAVSLIHVEAAGTTPSQRAAEQIPRGLKARIVALSRAATPYRIIEVREDTADGGMLEPKLADRARSPERGQLLVGLMLAGVDIPAVKGVTFGGADLRGADLTGANLTNTDLFGADLFEADLFESNLRNAQLVNAILTGANLSGADLADANLRDARLANANLIGANLASAGSMGANLSHADLFDANLANVNLASATLRQARLAKARMASAILSGADLTGADLLESNLRNAQLANAILTGASLTGADLADADLANANLIGASLVRATLTGAVLIHADLSGANLTGADLTDAIVGGTGAPGQLPEGFPKGWSGLPAGWELYDEGPRARLRRSGTPVLPDPP